MGYKLTDYKIFLFHYIFVVIKLQPALGSYREKWELDIALNYFQNSLKIVKKIQNKHLEATYLKNIGAGK